ncbi:methyltransferase [Saccharothrix saharensis]|uniref:methyltransferase n=1 Tax=Saccharothrix saharensis TaxID=571190 RepID=UPI00367DA42A
MTDLTPPVAVTTGFTAAEQLFAASEPAVSAALDLGPATALELAERAELPERSARVLADSMVCLGLLEHADGRYRTTAATSTYLAGRRGLDLRASRDARSHPHRHRDSLHAVMLAEHYDFRPHRRVLDLGGLSTAFLAQAAARHPKLTGAFVGTREFLDVVRHSVPPEVADRITFHEGDPLTGPVPGHYDAVLLEHVIHRFEPERNKAIMRAAREVVDPGGRLLVLDFLLLAEDARRLDPVLAGEYLVIDGAVVYPEGEVHGWLADTGWKVLETRPLPGSPRVVIAEAV